MSPAYTKEFCFLAAFSYAGPIMKALLLALLASMFFSHGLASAGAAGQLPELARSPGWQRLLYYKSHIFGGWKSAVDGPGFFLAPDGATNPEAELLATVRALENGGGTYGKLQQPIGCAFPLRKAFLEEALGKKFPAEPCPEFEDFLRKLNPAGVALVFATAYPNNPGSMFGHTFLKFI